MILVYYTTNNDPGLSEVVQAAEGEEKVKYFFLIDNKLGIPDKTIVLYRTFDAPIVKY